MGWSDILSYMIWMKSTMNTINFWNLKSLSNIVFIGESEFEFNEGAIGIIDCDAALIPVKLLSKDEPVNPNGKLNIELNWDVSERDVPIKGIISFFKRTDFFGALVSCMFDIEFRSAITDCIILSTMDFKLKFNIS